MLITKFEATKVLTSTEKHDFFVGYVGKYICSIPFFTLKRTRSLLKLISKINLEHMIKEHLPRIYSDDWEEDEKLQIYQEADSAFKRQLSSKGCNTVKELMRHFTGPPDAETPRVPVYSPEQYYYIDSFVWF